MAGTTRFGFAGGSSSDGPTPPDGEEPRPTRTLFGRDVHLRRSGLDMTAPATAPATPGPAPQEAPAAPRHSLKRSRVLTPMGVGERGRAPSHSGKSKLPA